MRVTTRARSGVVAGLALATGIALAAVPATATPPVDDAHAGSVITWGPGVPEMNIAPPTVPAEHAGSVFKDVAPMGPSTAVALTKAGQVVLLGTPVFGAQLPDSLRTATVKDVAASSTEDGIAVTDAGKLISWTAINPPAIAQIPPGLSGVDTVELGGDGWAAAIKSDGTVVAWGNDRVGQVSTLPPGLSDVTQLSLDSANGYALTSDGTVTTWGQRGAGSLPPVVTDATDALDVVTVQTGYNGAFALMSDGSIVDWTQSSNMPDFTGKKIIAIGANGAEHVAIDDTGQSYVWGGASPDMSYGQLPTGVDASRISKIEVGSYFAAAIVSAEAEQVASTTTATSPKVPFGKAPRVNVSVAPSTATGAVEVYKGTALLGSGTVADGTAAVSLPRTRLAPGKHALTVKYLGDANTEASEGTTTLTVTKAPSTTKLSGGYNAKKKQVRAVSTVVTSTGVKPTGKVKFVFKRGTKVINRKAIALNKQGKAVYVLKGKRGKGAYSIQAVYPGSSKVAKSARTLKFRIR